MLNKRILIIDGDLRFVQALREAFLSQEFEVSSVVEFKDTRFLVEAGAPHIVVVDGCSEIVKTIRAESAIPVIIMSSNDSVCTRVQALEAGADDFLVKPFEARELVARANSILRRVPQLETVRPTEAQGALTSLTEYRFKDLQVVPECRKVVLADAPVDLTTAEFDLLKLFVTNMHQVLSRDIILDRLRGIGWDAMNRSVDILVSRLREKLGDNPRSPRFIQTVRSTGYQFIAEPA
jgi:DNA-binding response OmpR family regulator